MNVYVKKLYQTDRQTHIHINVTSFAAWTDSRPHATKNKIYWLWDSRIVKSLWKVHHCLKIHYPCHLVNWCINGYPNTCENKKNLPQKHHCNCQYVHLHTFLSLKHCIWYFPVRISCSIPFTISIPYLNL